MRGWMYLGTFEGVHMYRQNRQYMGVVIESSTPTPTAEGVYAPDPVYAFIKSPDKHYEGIHSPDMTGVYFDTIDTLYRYNMLKAPDTVLVEWFQFGTVKLRVSAPASVSIQSPGIKSIIQYPHPKVPETVTVMFQKIEPKPPTEDVINDTYPVADNEYQ